MTARLAHRQVYTFTCDGCGAEGRDDDKSLEGWMVVQTRNVQTSPSMLAAFVEAFAGKRYDLCPTCAARARAALPRDGEDLPVANVGRRPS